MTTIWLKKYNDLLNCGFLAYMFITTNKTYVNNTKEMAGKATKMPNRITSETIKGATPRNMSLSLMCGAIALMTKIFIPIGGVIKPSSTVNTAIIPNQTGSNPSATMMG